MDVVQTRRIRVKIAMALLDLKNQKVLAKRADVDPKTVVYLLNGKVSPDLDTLNRIAAALGQRRSWLEGEGDVREFDLPHTIPLGTSIKQNGKTKLYEPPAASAGEAPAEYAKPQRIVRPVNRRHEIPVFKIVDRQKHGSVALPKWLNLACGEGCDLERCEDLLYFEGMDNFKGLHTAAVRGDSMIETLEPGDLIVLKPFPLGAGLKKLNDPSERTPLDVWRAKHDIREGDICVVSIRDRPPTLKRVHYDTSRGERHWKLQIVADNPAANWQLFQLDDEDWIVFHAKLIGRGQDKK